MKSEEHGRSHAVTRRARAVVGLGTSAAALAVVLSGCSLFGPSGDTPEQAQTKKSSSQPEAVRDVLKAVKPLTGKDSKTTSKAFFSTMVKAGYKKSALEATLDKTPLDTGVPATMFGVRVKDDCVVGEIRGGKATATLAEPSGSTGACLLGNVKRPDGVSTPTGKPRPDDQSGPTDLPGEGGSGENGSGEGDSGGSDTGRMGGN